MNVTPGRRSVTAKLVRGANKCGCSRSQPNPSPVCNLLSTVYSDAAVAERHLPEKRASSHGISGSDNGSKQEALWPGPVIRKDIFHDDRCHHSSSPTPMMPSMTMCHALWIRCALRSPPAAWYNTGGASSRKRKPGSTPCCGNKHRPIA